MKKKGVLLFAHDNGDVKYTDIAAWSAKRINRHLGLPVSIVTDTELSPGHPFDNIIQQTASSNSMRGGAPWRNMGRCKANELTPYDQTILLDADYVVCSDQLLTLFEISEPIVSMRWAFDITGRRNYDDLNFFGRHRMPSAWATMIYWNKSHTADLVFDMMSMIQENWQHYVQLYGILDHKFRNDYALAIASNTVMGHLGRWPEIPWNMANIDHGCDLEQLEPDQFEIRYLDQQQKLRKMKLLGTDFHAMVKKNLEAVIKNAG